MIELISNIAGILGGIAVLAAFGRWLWKTIKRDRNKVSGGLEQPEQPPSRAVVDPFESYHLSSEERDILIESAPTGQIHILRVDGFGSWVRCDGNVDFADDHDPAISAKYLEALERLKQRGWVVHEGGLLNRLTGSGFTVARQLRQQSDEAGPLRQLSPEASSPKLRSTVRQHLAKTLRRGPTSREVDELLAKAVTAYGVDGISDSNLTTMP